MSASKSQQSLVEEVDTTKLDAGTDSSPRIPHTFHGSCHCGRITYSVDLILPIHPQLPVATRCNCRICLKLGFTGIQLPNGRGSFKLLTPAALDDEGIVDYADKTGELHRWHCVRCGVTFCAGGRYHMPPTAKGSGEEGDKVEEAEGAVVEFFGVNVVTLDQPQEGLDLSIFKIEYLDGRNDNFMAGKRDTPWPGGIV